MGKQEKGKLKITTKLGYGIGALGDAIGYNLFMSFFIFFLTDVAGLPATVAGIVSLIAVFWDALTDTVVGFLSDNYRGKKGRRRTFMLVGSIPFGICMFLLFSDMNISVNIKSAYFILISMLFFTAYTIYALPYMAIGGELTENYDEKTSIRVFANFFVYSGVLLISTVPHLLVDFTQQHGGTLVDGWRNVGLFFGILIIASALLCVFFLRGKERFDYLKEEPERFSNIVHAYIEILKMKPAKTLAITIFLWVFLGTVMSGASMYFSLSVLGYDAETRAMLGTVGGIIPLVWLPVINFLAGKFDKKNFYGFAMIFSGTVAILFRVLIGFPSAPWMLVVYSVLFAFGNTTFWTVAFSLMYDISELDDFLNQKRRIGSISALMAFIQKLAAALALWTVGILLDFSGYDPLLETQTQSAAYMILNLKTVIPGVIGIAAGIFGLLHPLNKKRFGALMEAKSRKQQGQTYETEGFQKVL